MAKKIDPHKKCDKAIKGCFTAFREEKKKHEKANAAVLKKASMILNLYQDICDTLDKKEMTDAKKLARIERLNNAIGTTVSKILPG